MLSYLGLPVQASTHAAEIDQMIVARALADAGAVRRAGASSSCYVLFRFRKGANPSADYVGAKGKISKGIEVAVVVVEVVLLVFYAIPAWAKRVSKRFRPRTKRSSSASSAEQFAWNIHYPVPTACSAAPTSSWSARTTRSASTARTRTRRTTSRRSIS